MRHRKSWDEDARWGFNSAISSQLVRAIESYLVERNGNPKKYVWRASGLEILEKIKRASEALAAADVIST
jgi:hypothetical protein